MGLAIFLALSGLIIFPDSSIKSEKTAAEKQAAQKAFAAPATPRPWTPRISPTTVGWLPSSARTP